MPTNDPQLFVALDQEAWKALQSIRALLQERVSVLYANRHNFPIWPEHNEALDAFETELYAPVRHVYYKQTIFLIEILREFKFQGTYRNMPKL